MRRPLLARLGTTTVATALALAVAPHVTHAQSPSVDPGSTVRVKLIDSTSVVGRVVSIGGSNLTLDGNPPIGAIDRSRIARIELRSNHAEQYGARGAIGGLFVGGVVGWALPCAQISSPGAASGTGGCGNATHQYFVPGILLGGLAGLLTGSLIGEFVRTWQPARLQAAITSGDHGSRFSVGASVGYQP